MYIHVICDVLSQIISPIGFLNTDRWTEIHFQYSYATMCRIITYDLDLLLDKCIEEQEFAVVY